MSLAMCCIVLLHAAWTPSYSYMVHMFHEKTCLNTSKYTNGLRPPRHRAPYSGSVIEGRANSLGDEAVTCEWLPIPAQELRHARKHQSTNVYIVLSYFGVALGMIVTAYKNKWSCWVRGGPTRSILGAFGASLGSLGLPSGAFGGPLGCLWGSIWYLWGSIGVPLGGYLDAFGLECYCGEQKAVRWSFVCPQTPTFTIENGGHRVTIDMRAGATKVPCGPLRIQETGTEDTGLPRDTPLVPEARWRIAKQL